jgi:hypothetical protein
LIEYLLGIVARGNRFDARAALAALELYRDEERVRTRVLAAADRRAALRDSEQDRHR